MIVNEEISILRWEKNINWFSFDSRNIVEMIVDRKFIDIESIPDRIVKHDYRLLMNQSERLLNCLFFHIIGDCELKLAIMILTWLDIFDFIIKVNSFIISSQFFFDNVFLTILYLVLLNTCYLQG